MKDRLTAGMQEIPRAAPNGPKYTNPRTQLVDKIATKFQRLPSCFRGPAIQWNCCVYIILPRKLYKPFGRVLNNGGVVKFVNYLEATVISAKYRCL